MTALLACLNCLVWSKYVMWGCHDDQISLHDYRRLKNLCKRYFLSISGSLKKCIFNLAYGVFHLFFGNTRSWKGREIVTMTVRKHTKKICIEEARQFKIAIYGRWQPVLRCVTPTYCNKMRVERNRNDLRGTVLFTQHSYIYVVTTSSLLH